MADAVRYRTGLCETTGKLLTGFDHVRQSLGRLWRTHPGSRRMLLDFGTDLRSFLSEDLTPDLALRIYDMLIRAVNEWEPEYRVTAMQMVKLSRDGGLALRHEGLYYPEGRFGNYALVMPASVAASRPWRVAA